MNPLLNIIYLSIAFYFILPHMNKIATEPLYNKLLFVVISVVLQMIFELIVKKLKNENLFSNLGRVLERSLSKSILLLLGLLLYKDIKNSPSISAGSPIIGALLSVPSSEVIFIMVPTLLVITSKCLLKPY